MDGLARLLPGTSTTKEDGLIRLRTFLPLIGAFAAQGAAAVDSSEILFQDSPVRSYSIDFYGDTAWNTKLEAMWKADSGYLPARFFDGRTTLDSVGVRYKGNSSFTLAGNNPKKPLKIKFNEFKDTTYFGIKVLNFSNGIGDPSLMRERIGYAIARRLMPAPRANFAHITLAGAALGLYTQVEQIDKTFLKRWFNSSKGNLFKAGDDGASLSWLGDDARAYAASGDYELKTNEDESNWNGFARFVGFLDNSSDSVFCADRGTYLDDTNTARFLAFNTVLSHFDSYNGSGRNWYMYQPDTASPRMTMIPWDLNLSFGAYGGASGALSLALDTVQAPLADRPLFRRFLACPATRAAYLQAVRELVADAASTDSVAAMVVRDSAFLAPFVESDANKFYSTAAWKTNLRANVRGSEGLVLGLVSFSSERNARLSAQLESRTNVEPGSRPRPWRMVRTGNTWRMDGLERLGSGRIRWSGPDGRLLGSTSFAVGTSSIELPLPAGIVIVSVRSVRASHAAIVHNNRK